MLKYTDEEVAALVKKVKKGDLAAFDELVFIYQKFVYGTVLAQVKAPADAEAVSQKVFMKAWKEIAEFKKDSTFALWLHGIAENASKDFLKKKNKGTKNDKGKNKKEALEDTDSEKKASDKFSFIGDSDLESLINALPEQQREALIYRDLMGITYLEIADITGVTVGTVKNRISHARESVKGAIEEYLASRTKTES